VGFDWAVVGATGWLVAGGFLDGWAHNHFGATLETFFTPWHAVLYSGFAAVAALLLWVPVLNHGRGAAWRTAVPPGYGWSLAGVALFAAGGVLDLLWHRLFGIEVSVDALFSPSHLLLAAGGFLIGSGPLRAAWGRADPPAGARLWPRLPLVPLLPMLVSAAYSLSVMTFMTQVFNPFVFFDSPGGRPPGDLVFQRERAGVLSILLESALLMGWVLFLLRRWQLPAGSVTVLFTINALLMSALRGTYRVAPVLVLAGVVADGLLWWWRPAIARPRALRAFAFVVPVALFTFYYAALGLGGAPFWWSIHLLAGSVILAGVVGLLLSYLLCPPRLPTAAPPGR
jgi:hypothetical protein